MEPGLVSLSNLTEQVRLSLLAGVRAGCER